MKFVTLFAICGKNDVFLVKWLPKDLLIRKTFGGLRKVVEGIKGEAKETGLRCGTWERCITLPRIVSVPREINRQCIPCQPEGNSHPASLAAVPRSQL
jgi:hypothetical protein